jgi:hypothetical protein
MSQPMRLTRTMAPLHDVLLAKRRRRASHPGTQTLHLVRADLLHPRGHSVARRCCRYGHYGRWPSGQLRLSGSVRQSPPGSGFSSEFLLSRWPLGRTTKLSSRTANSTRLWSMGLCRILIAGRPARAMGTIRQRHSKMPIARLRNLYPPPISWVEAGGLIGPVEWQ